MKVFYALKLQKLLLGRKNSTKAFSLVEISIVLIIIGLITAGVFIGGELRQSAATRLVIKDFEAIDIALNNFNDSFRALPGDYDKAYQYWSDGCPSGGASACNGDSDQKIEAYKESHLAWLHLKLADFYQGSFTGSGDGDSNTQTANINVPASSFSGGQYALIYYDWNRFPDKHLILLGGKVTGDIGGMAIVDPNSAHEIDAKIDDGMPGTGKIYGRNGWQGDWNSTTCVIDSAGDKVDNSEAVNASWEYNMNLNTNECILGYSF